MTSTVKQGKLRKRVKVRYDSVVSVKVTKRIKDRLIAMAYNAGQIYPEYLRTRFERMVAEDDANRLGN